MDEIFKVAIDWAKPKLVVSTSWLSLAVLLLTALVLISIRYWLKQRSGYVIKELTVEIPLPGGKISGVLSPDESQRKAAWELYIELVTRISVVEQLPRRFASGSSDFTTFPL